MNRLYLLILFLLSHTCFSQKEVFVATAKKNIPIYPAAFFNASTTDSIYVGQKFIVFSDKYKSTQKVQDKTGKYFILKVDASYYDIDLKGIDYEKALQLSFMNDGPEYRISSKNKFVKLTIDPYGKRYFTDKDGNRYYP